MALPKIRYATVAEMERLSRPSVREAVLYCEETGKTYTWENVSTARDGNDVLNTGMGGNTRFVSRGGGGTPGGTVPWAGITGKPSTFPPSAHTQAWSTITDPPATYAPSVHGNAAHTSIFVTQTEIDSSINAHKALTASIHNFDASGNAPAQSHDNTRHSTAYFAAADHTTATHDALNIDADTLDGSHAAAFALTGHGHTHASTTGQTANDHHSQAHLIAGTDHTASGLTIGHVLRASGATAFDFAALQAADIPDLSSSYSVTGHAHTHASTTGQTANDHHNQSHGSGDHSGTIGAWSQIDKTTSSIADITTRSHTALTDIGTNTHAQIDTHIGSTSNPHAVTAAQAGAYATKNTVIDHWYVGINQSGTGDRYAAVYLYSGAGASDYTYFIRNAGTNGLTSFQSFGTGGLYFASGGAFFLQTGGPTNRWRVDTDGHTRPHVDATGKMGLSMYRWEEGHFAKLVAGLAVAAPVAKLTAYDNTTGATDPVFLAHQDHASNTGILLKGVHDGTGDLFHFYNGATSRGHLTYDGILDIYTGLRINAAATAGYVLQGNGTNIVLSANYDTVGWHIYEGGAVISTGAKGWTWTIPFAITILEWTLLGDTTGSIVLDLWADSYANYPPTVADTICGSAKPTISSSNKGQSSTLTGWTTSLPAGTIIKLNVDSCANLTYVAGCLKYARAS